MKTILLFLKNLVQLAQTRYSHVSTNKVIYTIPIWAESILDAKNQKKEIFKKKIENISKVKTPTLSIFLPSKTTKNSSAILIFPGGSYERLAIDKEGIKVAKWLNSLGIPAFVLKYRLPNDITMKNKTIAPLQDAQKAIRIIRKNANKWDINPDKIGVLGFSAGGHLASTLSTQFERKVYESNDNVTARPDFSILIYPVISMIEGITHSVSKINLLGKNPSQELINNYSNEKQINSTTPKTFLVHATDDKAVSVNNSINYYLNLLHYNIPAEMHIYEKGGHGFGLGTTETNKDWTKACEKWLVANKYISNINN